MLKFQIDQCIVARESMNILVWCNHWSSYVYLNLYFGDQLCGFKVRDWSFIRGGEGGGRVGWCKWGGGIPFCAPENRGLHKILQPFLRGHVVLCIPISVAQKRNNTEGINNKSNMIYYQNDRITKKGRGAVWPSGQHVGFTIHCSWLWVPPWPLLGFVSQ